MKSRVFEVCREGIVDMRLAMLTEEIIPCGAWMLCNLLRRYRSQNLACEIAIKGLKMAGIDQEVWVLLKDSVASEMRSRL
jgi:hypothetical protein